MFVALLFLLISVLMIILLDLKDKLAQMKKVAAAKEREIHDMKVPLDRCDIEFRPHVARLDDIVKRSRN